MSLLRIICFPSIGNLAGGGTEKGPLRLCFGGVWDYPISGKNQGKLRTNQPQLTPSSDLRTKKGISCAQIRLR